MQYENLSTDLTQSASSQFQAGLKLPVLSDSGKP